MSIPVRAALVSLALTTTTALAQWQSAPSFPASQTGRQYPVGLNVNSVLYALGGPPWVNGGDEDGSVHTLDPGASNWVEQIEFDGVGGFIRQGGGIDDTGQVLIFGGYNPSDPGGNPPDPFHYDLADGVSGSLAPRGNAAPDDYFAWCTDSSGRVYSLGGGPGPSANSGSPNTGYAERYLGSTDAWEVIAPMPTPAAGACAVADSAGHILVIGGYDANATARLTNVARYDIATDTWSDTAVPDLPVGLTDAKAVLGADGRVWVMGGQTGPVNGGTIVSSCYVLDAGGLAWSPGPNMAQARMGFGATLGDDDFIYVLGGITPAGGTDSCEKIYTTPCPVFSTQPADLASWTGQRATLASAAIGGGTVSFRWFRDGIALQDGPTDWGSEVSGAFSQTLRIDNVAEEDAADYHVEATNSCGTTLSDVARITVRITPDLPTEWTATVLHPSWATEGSVVYGVEGGQQVGVGTKLVPLYDTMYAIARPVIWSGTASSAVDVTPGTSVGGSISATNGQTQAGWWWWPYSCRVGGEWTTCYTRQAARWHGTAASHENLQASGWEYSAAADVGDTHIGGSVTRDDDVGNVWTHAALWPTTGQTHPADLHPAEFRSSSISAIDGDEQFGGVLTEFPFTNEAARWRGTRETYSSMHPAGASRSGIADAKDGQQVGFAEFGGQSHPLLWHGSADDYVDLLPIGAIGASVNACEGGLQLGTVQFANGTHPVVWAGEAERFVDLLPFLPAPYTTGGVTSMDVEPDGTIVVGGYGYNPTTGRTNAILWTSSDSPPCDADFNDDGDVNTLDVLAFLNAWTAGDEAADFNHDGSINTLDVLTFLNAWNAGC
ncbi:MAG: GC-type dockerin domain-anchored protein [Phycisphaerales bacterium JB054]